jgi:hypothetical protein
VSREGLSCAGFGLWRREVRVMRRRHCKRQSEGGRGKGEPLARCKRLSRLWMMAS